jgi:Carboxypeptidase regulatory-like domain
MGQTSLSRSHQLRRACLFHRSFLLPFTLLFASPLFAQSSPSPDTPPPPSAQISAAPSPQQYWPESIAGIVLDPTGTPIAGAKVTLSLQASHDPQEVLCSEDGRFAFTDIPPGPFQLTVTSTGFSQQTTSGLLTLGEAHVVPPITLALSPVVAEVHVGVSTFEIAQEEVIAEEHQRVLGFVPNYYVTYVPNAAPLNTKQKFNLAYKLSVDPVSFGLNAVSAGIEQATNQYSGYGQGAQGYAKRYGAGYADFVIGTFIGSAALPSLLKQDPRYFYKGTGSKRSRLLYAIANSVICKGDNGHWQANYSGILGSIASGGVSNLYYPPADRGASLIFENTAIGIGTTAAANILQEFVIRKITPNLPNHSPSSSP